MKIKKRNKNWKRINKPILTLKDKIWAAIVFVGVVVYSRSSNNIANYPSWIGYSMFAFVLILAILYLKKKVIEEINKTKDWISILSLLLHAVFLIAISFFISLILKVPFNYYNEYVSKKNKLEYVSCKIESVYTGRDAGVYYEYNGELNYKYTYRPIMEEIKRTGNYEDYEVEMIGRKGLFGSFVFENWKIRKK